MGAAGDDPESRLLAAVAEVARVTSGRPRVGLRHDEADDVAGTIATDDAFGFDPVPVLRALDVHGARVVVMGQVAGILHGSQELTGDLDLLWDGDPAQAPRLAEAFESLAAELSDAEGSPVPCAADAFLRAKVLFRAPTASGDCCTPALPWGDVDVTGMLDRADVARLRDGTAIRYIAAADLLTMRRAVGRPKDRRRADELAAILGLGTNRRRSASDAP